MLGDGLAADMKLGIWRLSAGRSAMSLVGRRLLSYMLSNNSLLVGVLTLEGPLVTSLLQAWPLRHRCQMHGGCQDDSRLFVRLVTCGLLRDLLLCGCLA